MSLPPEMRRWPQFRQVARAYGVSSLRAVAVTQGVQPPTTLQHLLVVYVNEGQPLPPILVYPKRHPTWDYWVAPGSALVWQDGGAFTRRRASHFTVTIDGIEDTLAHRTTGAAARPEGTAEITLDPSLPHLGVYRVTVDAFNPAREALRAASAASMTFKMIITGRHIVDSGGPSDPWGD